MWELFLYACCQGVTLKKKCCSITGICLKKKIDQPQSVTRENKATLDTQLFDIFPLSSFIDQLIEVRG